MIFGRLKRMITKIMRNWIRKILEIDSIDEGVNEINSKTQNKSEDISKFLDNNSNKNNPKSLEPVSKIQLSNNFGTIEFNLDRNFQLDENWILLNGSNQTENFFSQVTSASAISASSIYSASGLYTATTSINSLMTYGNGTLSSITMNGSKFGQHAGFVSANTAVFTPIIAFQFASMLTGQYYFNVLNKQLTSIHESINNLLSLHHNERLAKLRYIYIKISELNERSYFTTEDYSTIDKLKYDLSTIRFEYSLNAYQEIDKSLDKVNPVDKNNKFYPNSGWERTVRGLKNFIENSNKKATTLTNEIIGSKYFLYSKISLSAEHLYQLSKILEFKMNLSDKEPNSNRIGKIKELYDSISNIDIDNNVFNEIESINSQLKSRIETDFNILKENSRFKKDEINANANKINDELKVLEDLISPKSILVKEMEKIKNRFEGSTQIIIDNRNNKTEVYVKKQLNTSNS